MHKAVTPPGKNRRDWEIICEVSKRIGYEMAYNHPIPSHFKEAAANYLTITALDPVAKIPEYKVCAVKINKVGGLRCIKSCSQCGLH
ncbi:MAG: hypothetical protein J7J16_02435 [Deltaproteobacteria bacterium]|nr:hypothetical protein [Deltaproteobacteria bacterium]